MMETQKLREFSPDSLDIFHEVRGKVTGGAEWGEGGEE